MSSPGSGKTTTLLALINKIKAEMKIGVMEADIDAAVDAEIMAKCWGKNYSVAYRRDVSSRC